MRISRVDSSDADVCKFVFDFDTAVAETVLYKYPTYEERTVICCSTQSGCPIGCRFCGAGDNFVRNLSGDEIVWQVVKTLEEKGISGREVKKFQIMFMSMGEPMLNYKNLEYAIRTLHYLYPNAALLISTSGPFVSYKALIDLSVEINKIGLQFSVHESTDEKRDALIPFAAKLNLEEISLIGRKWYMATGRQPFFNYCAHEGNTSNEDADRLLELFDPTYWQATISVICERDESVAAANARQQELATNFMGLLNERGFSTRCFNPAGQDDIGGGCGQLWYVQDWMKKHPDLARPTIGQGIPIVHTPR